MQKNLVLVSLVRNSFSDLVHWESECIFFLFLIICSFLFCFVLKPIKKLIKIEYHFYKAVWEIEAEIIR